MSLSTYLTTSNGARPTSSFITRSSNTYCMLCTTPPVKMRQTPTIGPAKIDADADEDGGPVVVVSVDEAALAASSPPPLDATAPHNTIEMIQNTTP